jgi:hypothetical protein
VIITAVICGMECDYHEFMDYSGILPTIDLITTKSQRDNPNKNPAANTRPYISIAEQYSTGNDVSWILFTPCIALIGIDATSVDLCVATRICVSNC